MVAHLGWQETGSVADPVVVLIVQRVAGARIARIAEGVTVPNRPYRDITSDDVLSPAEVQELVASAPERWSAFLLCCAWLGWRHISG